MANSALVETAVRLLVDRQERECMFGSELFGDPAWAILLALYVAAESNPAVSPCRILKQVGCPESSGMRWLKCLEERALVRIERSDSEKRIETVSLTDRALYLLDTYLIVRRPTVPWG
jgi:DNA-binding MarR family transcriptional regulator